VIADQSSLQGVKRLSGIPVQCSKGVTLYGIQGETLTAGFICFDKPPKNISKSNRKVHPAYAYVPLSRFRNISDLLIVQDFPI